MENAGSGPRDGQFSQGSARPGLAEAYVVWALLPRLVRCSCWSRTRRIRPDDLYNVSRGGLAGGLEPRARLPELPDRADGDRDVLALVADRTRLDAGLRSSPLALCAVIVVPGVVDEADLDAKWINVVPALGVAIVLVLTAARRAGRLGRAARRPRPDRRRGRARVPRAAWIFAEVGFYIPGGIVPRASSSTTGHASSISASTTASRATCSS